MTITSRILQLGRERTINKHYCQNNNGITNEELLESLKIESNNILMRFTTAFPFDFFPDTIIIDENKVNIITRDFFLNYHLRSILIQDISDISVDTGLFFASLTIVDSSNYRFPITEKIDFLTKENALKARNLIQGLVIAKSKNVRLSEFPIDKVREEIEILGQSSL